MLDDAMLKTKKFKEFMEPLDKRIDDVVRFLRIFKRGLIYEVYKKHAGAKEKIGLVECLCGC